MTELDILADLEAIPVRPRGVPCRIALMRRDRPDLVGQWTAALASRHSGQAISAWFTNHEFPLSRSLVERHRQSPPCAWCIPGQEITA